MTLHNKADRLAAFPSGVGITPLLGVLRQGAKHQTMLQWYSFYSNRRPENALFLVELRRLVGIGSHFSPTITATDQSDPSCDGEPGTSKSRLSPCLNYLDGPAAMVAAMPERLNSGVANDIRSEEFRYWVC
jgi:ferredoxin-NADP reductase